MIPKKNNTYHETTYVKKLETDSNPRTREIKQKPSRRETGI